MTQYQHSTIQGAYLMGFEPSEENLTPERLTEEAEQFMANHLFTI